MEQDKKVDARKTERDNNIRKIDSMAELIGFCLKSKSFDLLLVLMIGFVWCGIILLKITVEGEDSTMLLFAIYVWPILISVFFLVMFGGMLFLTRHIKKSMSSLIIFAAVVISIPVIMILSPLSRMHYSDWI